MKTNNSSQFLIFFINTGKWGAVNLRTLTICNKIIPGCDRLLYRMDKIISDFCYRNFNFQFVPILGVYHCFYFIQFMKINSKAKQLNIPHFQRLFSKILATLFDNTNNVVGYCFTFNAIHWHEKHNNYKQCKHHHYHPSLSSSYSTWTVENIIIITVTELHTHTHSQTLTRIAWSQHQLNILANAQNEFEK